MYKNKSRPTFPKKHPNSEIRPRSWITRFKMRLLQIDLRRAIFVSSSSCNKFWPKNLLLQTWQWGKHLPQTLGLQLLQCVAPVQDQLVPHQDGGRVQHRQRRDPLLHPLQLRHQQDESGPVRSLQLHDEHLWEVKLFFSLFLLKIWELDVIDVCPGIPWSTAPSSSPHASTPRPAFQ